MKAAGDLQFYDRSPFCTYALLKYLGFDLSEILEAEIDRCLKANVYQNKVFFIENTNARRISYEDALIFEQIHLEVYKEFDFEIIMVPKGKIEQRCEFILKEVKAYLGASFVYSGTENHEYIENNSIHIKKTQEILKI